MDETEAKHTCRPTGYIAELLARADIGHEKWWQHIAKTQTPIIEEGDNDRQRVAFFWRDPYGNEQHSTIALVLIDVHGITDHYAIPPTCLQRVPLTDVWYWITDIDMYWQGGYQFIPLTKQQIPISWKHSHEERRHWLRHSFPCAEADRFNPLPAYLNHWSAPQSFACLAKAPRQPLFWTAKAPDTIIERRWRSQRLANERTVWCYAPKPSHQQTPLIILLDGQLWAQRLSLWPAIEQQTLSGQLPNAVWLMIDSLDATYREQELPCNAAFWLALQQELLPWVSTWMPASDRASKTLLVGQSYGGLAALYGALFWPQRFGCVLTQSASFWWPHFSTVGQHDATLIKPGWLTEQVLRHPPMAPLKIFQEVGKYERDIATTNQQMYQALNQKGHHVRYRLFHGGHDPINWRSGLLDGVKWLLTANLSFETEDISDLTLSNPSERITPLN